MHGEELKQAKARVDVLIVDPLELEGMARKRGVSIADHERYLEELRNRLAYMAPNNLHVMRGVIRANALGVARNNWPGMVSIKNWAHALQDRPEADSRLVLSYMASAAGRAAWERMPEEAVSLRRYLKKVGRPPTTDYEWKVIRDRASGWRHDLERIRDAECRSELDESDRNYLESFRKMRARVEKLVFGEQREAVNA